METSVAELELPEEAPPLRFFVVDGFLSQFEDLQAYAFRAPYVDVTNPVDGAVYPKIQPRVPNRYLMEIGHKIATIMGAEIHVKQMFLRLTTEGTPVPHQAHTDMTMGQFSFMLYMTDIQHCAGGDAGTAFLRHKRTGMEINPQTLEELAVWSQDMNDPDAWEVMDLCEMAPNRACIFDARMFHRAEPIGGFGTNPQNGRLVLTAFFDIV